MDSGIFYPSSLTFKALGQMIPARKRERFCGEKIAKFENSDFLEFCMGINEPEACVQDFSSKEGPYASFEVLAS